MPYMEGEFPTVVYGDRNNSNNNGWGNDWSWIIGLAIIGALFGGNGFGFGGGNRGGACATQADLSAGFASNSVLSNLNDILLSQAQGFANVQQTLCQGFSGVNATVNQGFAGVNNAICTLGYQQAQLVNGLSRELGDCCCKTQVAIQDLKYANERQTCELITNQNANTRAILDYLTGEKISALQAENSGLKAQISNDRQSAYLLNELKPCPIPAYLTCNPNAPYGLGYGVGYGFNSHNGGCCGASIQ